MLIITILLLFIIGCLGFILTKNVLKWVLSLELILLGGTIIIFGAGSSFNDLDGQLIGLYLIVLAGVESIVGLSLIIQYYSIEKSEYSLI